LRLGLAPVWVRADWTRDDSSFTLHSCSFFFLQPRFCWQTSEGARDHALHVPFSAGHPVCAILRPRAQHSRSILLRDCRQTEGKAAGRPQNLHTSIHGMLPQHVTNYWLVGSIGGTIAPQKLFQFLCEVKVSLVRQARKMEPPPPTTYTSHGTSPSQPGMPQPAQGTQFCN
jgi:hypothetical protein